MPSLQQDTATTTLATTRMPPEPTAVTIEPEVRLIYRPATISPRSLIRFDDLKSILWIATCTITVLAAPQRWHPRLCALLARFPSRRKSRAAIAARKVGGFVAGKAEEIGRELQARRLGVDLHAIKGAACGDTIHVIVRGREHFDAALTGRKGVVLWIADFVEAGDATKIGFANAGHRLSHLSRPEHGFSKSRFGIAYLNWIRREYENQFLHQRIVFDRQAPQLAMAAMLRLLEENRAVSIKASAHEGRAFAEAGFFEGRLCLALGALKLARKAGCPVLPVFTLPGSDLEGFEVTIEPPLCVPNDSGDGAYLVAGVKDFVNRLEGYVSRRPAVWVGWSRSNLTAAKGGERAVTPLVVVS